MKRILILQCFCPSNHEESLQISHNLFESYKNLESSTVEIRSFEITKRVLAEDMIKSGDYLTDLVQQIKDFNPTEVVFTDYSPFVLDVLKALSTQIQVKEFPNLIVHLYGDFLFHSSRWFSNSPFLKELNIKFLVHSHSQLKLLKKFLNSDKNFYFCSFPVNAKDFYFDSVERKELRQKELIEKDEFILLATGKIGLQKNIDLLIKQYVDVFKYSKGSCRLWIAGPFDDSGAFFQGVVNYEGFMFSKINDVMSGLPRSIAESIKFWGYQPQDDLRKLKNASDLYINLGLTHDEPYDMHPQNALASGLPVLLTDWGSHSDLFSAEWESYLIPVELREDGHHLKLSYINDVVNELIDRNIEDQDRRISSSLFLDKFSIQPVSEILKSILFDEQRKFEGFDLKLSYYSKLFWYGEIGQKVNKEFVPSSNNFYGEVYKGNISGKSMRVKND